MIIKLLILEDDPGDSRRLLAFCQRYAKETGYNLRAQAAASPGELPQDMGDYDAALLDIMVGGIPAGVETARRLRMDGWKGALVFITSSTDFYPEGFEVGAVHYLVKPLTWETFLTAMERVVHQVGAPGLLLTLPVPRGTLEIPAESILYAEVYDHDTLLHTAVDTVRISLPLRDVETMLPAHFLRCFRSCIVNLAHIARMEESHFLLTSGARVPISQRSRAEIQSRYLDYRQNAIREGVK